jgi:hypothetical protein
VRLRPLTEAECYARCYGGRRGEAVNFVRLLPHEERKAPRARELAADLFDPVMGANEGGRDLEAA